MSDFSGYLGKESTGRLINAVQKRWFVLSGERNVHTAHEAFH